MSSPLHRPVRAVTGVGIMFASNGFAFASLLPWYPLFAKELQLSATQFGFIVAAFAVGSVLSSAAPTPLIARWGALRVGVVGTALLGFGIAAAAWAPSGLVLAITIATVGLFDAIVDVAQNVAGIRVQARVGRSVLSSMHALWSLGGVVGAATGTAAAAAGLDPRLHLAAVAVACVALVGTGARLIGAAAAADATVPDPATAEAATAPRTRSRVGGLLKLALPLVIVAICGVMVEDVANNWAAMSATQIGGIPVGSAGIAFTIVLAAQCLGRFSGDLLIQRFGRAAVSRSGGVFIAAGGALIVCASGPVLLCVGLALAGWGCATLVPSAMAAAAELPGVSEGAGVTLVSWLMRIGFLITSPLIGSVTDAVSLRAGLGLLVVVGLTVVLLSGSLRQKVRPAAEF